MNNNSKIISRVETITPEYAADILAKSEGRNRPTNTQVVQLYTHNMKRGEWTLNGESVIIDSTGRLVEGFHRFMACVASKTAFKTIIVRGVEPEVFSTIGRSHSSRSPSDHLAIAYPGIPKNIRGLLTGAQSVYLGFKRRVERSAGESVTVGSAINVSPQFRFSEGERALSAGKDEVTIHLSKMARKYRIKNQFPSIEPTFVGILRFFWNQAPELVEDFLHKFGTGEMLEAGSPALTLRRKLTPEKGAKQFTRELSAYLICRALLAEARGERLSVLKIVPPDHRRIPSLTEAIANRKT